MWIYSKMQASLNDGAPRLSYESSEQIKKYNYKSFIKNVLHN